MDADVLITFYVIAGIVYLIITISMIVKFFQIAKDLNYLKEKKTESFNFLISNGYKDEAKKVLLKEVWESDTMYNLRLSLNNKDFDVNYDIVKAKFKEKFNRLGEDFPKYEYFRPNK